MGKGGGSSHTPQEAKDNLKSTQLFSVIDAVSEGPIEGPVSGLGSVLVNNTPVVDAAGKTNIHGVRVVYRTGELEQTPPEGFESTGAETPLGVAVKYDNPVTRYITAERVDRLRLTFGVQSLVATSKQGDRDETTVRLLVQLERGGQWITEKDITINGKTTSQFLASVVVDNLPPRPFGVRMVRLTADSTSDQLQNATLWSSFTEIIDVRQRYPGTAIIGLQVDAEQFGSQQVTRNYHLKGRIVRVPDNYDPLTRTYTGLWGGAFKPAWTDNPAWCLLDMLTHPRYGLGERIRMDEVDKWALYGIAQYCDQRIPDGYGNTAPRITCNASLATQRRAWEVLTDFCSMMRCMPVWNGSTLTFVQDRPADTVWSYNRSNVVAGEDGTAFRYSFSALKDRHNAVEVNYVDPDNGWQTTTELVEDPQAIVRYGRNVLKMDAFACTSRGQAHRAGLWLIKTELLETRTVDFSTGAEGLRHVPGDVIEVCDEDYAGTAVGGRVLAVDALRRRLRLDRAVEVPASGTASLTLTGGDGLPVTVDVVAYPAPDEVTVSRLPDGVKAMSVWGLRRPELRRQLYRCVAIRENEDGTFAVTALQHVPEKEAVVDNGVTLDPLPGTGLGLTPPPVERLTVDVEPGTEGFRAQARWSTPRTVRGVSFRLRLTVSAGDGDERLVSTASTTESEYRFARLSRGRYTLSVTAVNGYGQQGEAASTAFRIDAPDAPAFVDLTPGYFQITVTPRQATYDPTVRYEFWYAAARITDIRRVESAARWLGTAGYWMASGSHIRPGMDHFFYIRAVNAVGKSVFTEATGRASDNAEGYLDFFRGQINATHLGEALLGQVDLAEDNASRLKTLSEEWQDARGKWNAMWGVKIAQTKDGRPYVAGLGLSMEDTDDGKASQFLVAANRIAFIDPANGNETPMFVAQGGQVFMNEVFLKFLTAPSITSGGQPPTFTLTPDGRLTARNADISGTVNATGGTFSNVTISKDCTILGTLRAEQIIGDLVKAVSRPFPHRGANPGLNSSGYPDGTLTVQVKDDHSFDRQIVIPPVMFRGTLSRSIDDRSMWATTCTLEVSHNGQQIYRHAVTGEGGTFSRVIDMPAGRGHATLTFTVTSRSSNKFTPSAWISDLLAIVVKKSQTGISIS